MARKKILISAGGTGGHLYPAQGLAQQLIKLSDPCEVLFVAGGLSVNRCFDRDQFQFKEIACSPLISKNPFKLLLGLKNLIQGTCQSLAILKNFKPDAVVGFGSYYTVPIMLAARFLKIPIILHEANSIPGRANKWLASLSDIVALNFPFTSEHFKGKKSVEVGLPLREGYQRGTIEREAALAYYQLNQEKRTLLIFGGSQGAQAINRSIRGCVALLKRLDLQVIHFTGDQKTADSLSSFYAANHIPANVKPFEKQMQMAWSAADGFLGRSGASTIAEAIEFEKPGILIPYPHATDNHQEQNANFLVDSVGSAWKILEKDLDSEKLGNVLEHFFEKKQMEMFRHALKVHNKRPNQITLCDLVMSDFSCDEVVQAK